MNIAFAYHLDASSPGVQSGRPNSILTQLRRLGVSVEEIFPLKETASFQRLALRILNGLRRRHYLLDRHETYLRNFSVEITERMRGTPDVIFSPSTLPLSYLNASVPISFCADAPFSAMREYYGSFSRLSPKQLDLSEHLEKSVLDRAALAVYPSQWAAQSAIRHYSVDRDKVAVIPFGANMGQDNQRVDVERWIEERPADELRILFVGKEWDRKGGPLVLETVRWLKKQGLRVTLDVVGPPSVPAVEPSMHAHGALSANRKEDRQKLEGLFSRAHFFFVPSRAEAYGMVFCEANAFGVPALASETGGITEIVRNGVNGHILPIGASGQDYGRIIAGVFLDILKYRQMAGASFAEFESRLNWGSHCETFLQRLEERLAISGSEVQAELRAS